MSRYYDIDGKPVSLNEWMRAYKDDRRIGDTTLADGKRVSTVFLGLDHQFGDGPPLIFETMVFPSNSYAELDCKRYTTKAEAIAGHAAMVKKWEA